MALTYLGVENPLGVLGPRVRKIIDQEADLAPLAGVTKHEKDAGKYAQKQVSKYDVRVRNLSWQHNDIGPLMIEDTVSNREYVVKLFRKRGHYPDLRIAMCSSLNSMMKYMATYVANNVGTTFDTVIIYGHGSPGSINLGLGKVGIGPWVPPGDEKHAELKTIREVYGLDHESAGEKPRPRRVRDLSSSNTDSWAGKFGKKKDCFEENEVTGCFHMFLMGCRVGAKSEKNSDATTLQVEAARALRRLLGISVCVAAPEESITDDHLDDLLARMTEVRQKCFDGAEVYLGEGKDKVKLAASKGF